MADEDIQLNLSFRDDRYIRLGDEKWTHVHPFALPWKISSKGNAYITLDVHGQRVTLSVFGSKWRTDAWTFSTCRDDVWTSSRQYFESEDEAKTAAIRSISGVIDESPSDATPEPRSDGDNLNRRIRL